MLFISLAVLFNSLSVATFVFFTLRERRKVSAILAMNELVVKSLQEKWHKEAIEEAVIPKVLIGKEIKRRRPSHSAKQKAAASATMKKYWEKRRAAEAAARNVSNKT